MIWTEFSSFQFCDREFRTQTMEGEIFWRQIFLNLFLFSTFIFLIKMFAFLQNSRDNNIKWKSLYSLRSLWSLNSKFRCIEKYWMHNYITRSSDLYFCCTISYVKAKKKLLVLNYTFWKKKKIEIFLKILVHLFANKLFRIWKNKKCIKEHIFM